jgi:hypothetical protein
MDRQPMTTVAPLSTNSCVIAYPVPLLAPVTTQIAFVRSRTVVYFVILGSISVFKEYNTIPIRPNRLIKADMRTGGAINNVINATIETATHKA